MHTYTRTSHCVFQVFSDHKSTFTLNDFIHFMIPSQRQFNKQLLSSLLNCLKLFRWSVHVQTVAHYLISTILFNYSDIGSIVMRTNPNFTIPSSSWTNKTVKDKREPNLRRAAELNSIILLWFFYHKFHKSMQIFVMAYVGKKHKNKNKSWKYLTIIFVSVTPMMVTER